MCCRTHAVRAHAPGGHPAARHPFFQFERHHYPGYAPSPGFGVRRPLRFLAWKLQLDEAQVGQLATILSELKTERAQAEVDDHRALGLLAEAAQGESFDRTKAGEAAALRTRSAERLQQVVAQALERIHAILTPEQRGRLAYLLRTGTLTM